MKAVPLPFEEFRGKGVVDFTSSCSPCSVVSDSLRVCEDQKWNTQKQHCYVGSEPTSVLDIRSNNPSPPTSSSTLSSSYGSSGGGAGVGSSSDSTTGAAAGKRASQTTLEVAPERCGMGMEDWESVLSESPGQDQSILRLIMGDIEDPSVGLSKLLQSGGTGTGSADVEEFNGGGGGFGVMDQSSVLDPISSSNFTTSIEPSGHGNFSDFPFLNSNVSRVSSSMNPNPIIFSGSATNSSPLMFHNHPHQQLQQQQAMDSLDKKPQIMNPQFILNHNQAQFFPNPAFVMPATYSDHPLLSPPPAKRLNSGAMGANYQPPKAPLLDSGQEMFLRRQQQQQYQRPPSAAAISAAPKLSKMVSPGEEMANQQLQQAIIDKLFKAAEMMETGNPELAQEILARLNHQLSPIGKPFLRASFYMKEALLSLLHSNPNSNHNHNHALSFSPTALLLKISAYKSFSEISPLLQFSNFTSNQALLEAVDGFDRVHIIDFDIGFGGQWASFMQELALKNGGAPSLKITAFVSPSNHDQLELTFTQENLKQYASEINMPFELEILSLESLNSASWPQPLRDSEAILVNLPIASFSSYPSYLPLVLRFLKQLMPKIVVTLDRSSDRTDAPFPQHVIHAIQSYTGLFESLDAVNVNLDVLQMIEKYFLQPAMEKLVLGRQRLHERIPPWKTLLLNSGFSPLAFSSFTESQAECLVQRTPARGFHVEKRQSSLVLCYQRKDLISVSIWRC